MKHIINLLITLILTGFAVGIAWLAWNDTFAWGVLYIPWFVLTILWGNHITKTY
jgi:hypothetical protein